mgnify:CR=1 FL=1
MKQAYRGHCFGRMLLDRVCGDHPDDAVYVMSDVDEYYLKQDYQRIGSVFRIQH